MINFATLQQCFDLQEEGTRVKLEISYASNWDPRKTQTQLFCTVFCLQMIPKEYFKVNGYRNGSSFCNFASQSELLGLELWSFMSNFVAC